MKAFILTIFLLLSLQLQAAVSRQEFEVIKKDFSHFISKLGKKLDPTYTNSVDLVEDSDFNAYATNPITVNTGMINAKSLTIDSFLLILCHEAGHNEDLAYLYTPKDTTYGYPHLLQEYFATYACVMPLLKSSKVLGSIRLTNEEVRKIPLDLQMKCQRDYPQEASNAHCLRIVKASLTSMLTMYEEVPSIRRIYANNKFPLPNLSREWRGSGDELQSRLMTYLAGLFKEAPFDGPRY